MIRQVRPTRAEVADIAQAVHAQVDALMLTAEPAVGAHPVEAVQMMDRVARRTEERIRAHRAPLFPPPLPPTQGEVVPSTRDALSRAVAQLSRELAVRAIVAFSRTGTTARVLSGARPPAPLVAISPDPGACRAMRLLWGVVPAHVPDPPEDPQALARLLAAELGLAGPGDRVLLVRGFHREPAKEVPSVTVVTL